MKKKLVSISMVIVLGLLGPAQPLMAADNNTPALSQTESSSQARTQEDPETDFDTSMELNTQVETETQNSKNTFAFPYEPDLAIEPESETDGVEKSSTVIESAAESETKTDTTSHTESEELDYILGRPMTDEELKAQESIALPEGSLPSSGLPSLSSDGKTRKARSVYPSSYDSRKSGYVTPVRDQGKWNTCWAFAPLACAETSLIKKGLFDNSLDLSERQLAYFFYFTQTDPMGLTKGDVTASYKHYLEGGGNNIFTIFSLAKWIGASSEADVPYSNFNTFLQPSMAYQDVAHLQNAYIVPSSSITDMKKLILTHGAISVNIYAGTDNNNNDFKNYYNPNTGAFCYKPQGSVNSQDHTLAIVGWDDNYKKTNFLSGKRPQNNGAWLAKNSWGTDIGKEGYFWISYEDAFLQSGASDALAFAYDFESADNYDHNYQYDGTSNAQIMTFNSSTAYISNVYKVQGSTAGSDEALEAVSFAHYTPGTGYEIQIYKNPKKAADPTSGTPMLKTPQTGSTAYAGYHTVQLSNPINFAKGNTFSVVIKLTAPSGVQATVFTDASYDNNKWILFSASSSANQSFIKTENTSWTDMNTMNQTVRLKAFTSDLTTTSISKMSLAVSDTTLTAGSTATITANISPAKATYSSISWSSSNKKIATVKASGTNQAVVTATGYGTVTITGKTNTGSTAAIKLQISAPAFSKLSSRGYNSINLSWNKVSTADGYAIYRSTSKNGTYKRIKIISGNSTTAYADKKLTTGMRYYYQIRTYTTAGNSRIYSNASSKRSCIPVPSVVSLKNITKQDKKLKLSWKSIWGADGYEIYRSTAKKGTYKRLKTVAGKSSVSYLTAYNKKTTYYYKVRAYRKMGRERIYGAFSSVKYYTP